MNQSDRSDVIEVIVNGQPQAIAAGATVAQLLQSIGVRTELVAVELNLDIVPKHQHAQTIVREGDQLEVVTLVGGG